MNHAYMSFCFSIALSDILLDTNMALRVPLSDTKPYCFGDISCNIMPRTLFITTHRINFVMWLIRLSVRSFFTFGCSPDLWQSYEYRFIQFLWEITMVIHHICKPGKFFQPILSSGNKHFCLHTVRTRGFLHGDYFQCMLNFF